MYPWFRFHIIHWLRRLLSVPEPRPATQVEEPDSPNDRIDGSSAYVIGHEIEHLTDELRYINVFITAHRRTREGKRRNDRRLLGKAKSLRRTIDARLAATGPEVDLRLHHLARGFGLDHQSLAWHLLLACLVAHVGISGRNVFAYAGDDVSGSGLSVDLLTQLFSPLVDSACAHADFATALDQLSQDGLVQIGPASGDPESATGLRYASIEPCVAEYLYGADTIDRQSASVVQVEQPRHDLQPPSTQAEKMLQVLEHHDPNVCHRGLLFLEVGVYGTGRLRAAEYLACQHWQQLIVVNVSALVESDEHWHQDRNWNRTVDAVYHMAACRHAMVYWNGVEDLLTEEHAGSWRYLMCAATGYRGVTFFASSMPWDVSGEFRDTNFYRFEFAVPAFDQRQQIWQRQLECRDDLAFEHAKIPIISRLLAGNFQLTEGQIFDAIAEALRRAVVENPQSPCISEKHLQDACRIQAGRRLQDLARRIVPAPDLSLDDIVLPKANKSRLQDLRSRIDHQAEVAQLLGGRRQLSLANGQIALFTGPSGTGKTMAAERIASMTSRDLYKIDLSAIVSKWVGETEKNLSRVFAEAEDSSAIIFFDEADALFSKRGEVREARDKWANLETNYLLQRMDDYSGPVILATNFRQNLDDAFLRRIQILVEFPFPGPDARAQILENLLRSGDMRLVRETAAVTAPMHDDDEKLLIDVITKRFQVSGASLRNVVVDSAFQTVAQQAIPGTRQTQSDSRSANASNVTSLQIPLRTLVVSIAREYEKVGKSVTQVEFGERFFSWYEADVLRKPNSAVPVDTANQQLVRS